MVILSKDELLRLTVLGVGGLVTAEEFRILVAQARVAIGLLEACELAEATVERLNRHSSANGTLDVLRAAIHEARGTEEANGEAAAD